MEWEYGVASSPLQSSLIPREYFIKDEIWTSKLLLKTAKATSEINDTKLKKQRKEKNSKYMR